MIACIMACGPSTSNDDQDTGAELCVDDAPTGELVWSRLDDASRPRAVAFDPLSDSGEFYVAHRGQGDCLTRHDGRGNEQRTVPGSACGAMAIDSGGNLLLTESPWSGPTRIVKIDPEGVERWSVESVLAEGRAQAQGIVVDAEDNVILVGTDGVADTGDWMMKLDTSGEQQWLVPLDRNAVGRGSIEVGVDATGGIHVAHDVMEGSDPFIRVHRFDPDGMEVWSLDLEGPYISVEAMAVGEDGRSVIGWYTFSSEGPVRWLGLIDTDGRPVWTQRNSATDHAQVQHIALDPCGTVVVGGWMNVTQGERRIWLSKLTMDGDPLWSRTIDGVSPGGWDYVEAIAVDRDGRVVVAGAMTVEIIPASDDDSEELGDVHVRHRWLGLFER